MINIPTDLSLRRPTWAEIDLNKLRLNFARIRKLAPSAGVIAVVKSDAYGHGAVAVARELAEAGAAFFGTATAEEAIELRNHGIDTPILVLSGIIPSQFPLLLECDFIPAVYNVECFRELESFAAKHNRQFSVHVKIDTGMHRLGLPPKQAAELIANNSGLLKIEGVYTHFANADVTNDPYTMQQLETFERFVARHCSEIPMIHAANSAAIIRYPGSHFRLVRPGILLYGITPWQGASEFEPILSLKSRVIFLQRIAAGERIGYGLTFQAQKDSLIATVPFGYSDGLRRTFSNRLKVDVHGALCSVAGTISMDLCMVDVTEMADRIKLYDPVTLLGPKVSAWDWATLLDTLPYEITCLIAGSLRVPRLYIKDGCPNEIR